MDCSPPGSSAHGSLQARVLNGLPFPPPRDLPNPGVKPTSLRSPALAGGLFATVDLPNPGATSEKEGIIS